MIRDNIYFHNVTELEESLEFRGVLLRRFPRAVRHAMGDRGKFIAEEATGCEVRFVTEAKHVRVSVGIPEQDGILRVYKGGMFHSEHYLAAGTVRTLHLEEPTARFSMVDREHLVESGFAPEVWRLCYGRSTGLFAGVNAFGYQVRPPSKEEMPSKRWLAYGSSITHGLDNFHLSYVHQAARRLKLDVMNAGLGGSCLCEREVANFIAGRKDWDLASFELGVNMRDGLSDREFETRTAYLLEETIRLHPDKPLFLITIFPNFATFANSDTTDKDRRFNYTLRNHAERLNHPLLHVIEGDEIMTDMSGMTCDLIHPSDYGHMRMGERLAAHMEHRI